MGTVVGSWRLRLILILVVFATLMYTANALFGNISSSGAVNEDGYLTYDELDEHDIGYNQSDLGTEKSTSFVDVLFGIGDFLTFGSVDNMWARTLLNGIMALCWITIGYIIFTFIKEWIPFV